MRRIDGARRFKAQDAYVRHRRLLVGWTFECGLWAIESNEAAS